MNMTRLLLMALLAAALAGCESAPVREIKSIFQPSKAEQDLSAGIKQYEDGEYGEAARLLQASLDQGLSGKPDQVKAHKYLAFIHCVSNRQAMCREEFRLALKIDPSFELAANEAGHPIWGPAFRSVKGRR